ncbi:MAG: hypothetical protein GF315_01370 [candidate division Zixibacteria bacterium]|nr:hypothetical protein [candidate division Zixibacteria bacterium]
MVKMKALIPASMLVLICTSLVLSGCNIFGWTAGDDSVEGYMAKGKQHMRDGEYADALIEFEKALEAEPTYADARYYHAKANVLAAGFDIGVIIDELDVADNEGENLPFYSPEPGMTQAENLAYKNRLYQTNLTVIDDLTEIYEGNATGSFGPDDVEVDLLVSTSVVAMVGFLDTDRDGDIDEDDLSIEISSIEDGTYEFQSIEDFFDYDPGGDGMAKPSANPDTMGAHHFNELLLWAEGKLVNSRNLIVSLLQRMDSELDIDEIDGLLINFRKTIIKYYVNTGGEGNPGDVRRQIRLTESGMIEEIGTPGDNDNQGGKDDEVWGAPESQADSDGDGLKWEDSVVLDI